jgi:hypothetical protein
MKRQTYSKETITSLEVTQVSNKTFERLNGFTCHENWLENLFIATSKQEVYRFQHKKL